MKKIALLLLVCLLTTSFKKKSSKTIYLQPLGDVNKVYTDYVKSSITTFYGYECVVKSKVDLSNDLLAKSKTRYEASKIIKKFKNNQNILIITEKDIAYKKSEKFKEYGIFGLGDRPGKTCVISTFRLKNNGAKKMLERLKKVSLHEIGHNLGLEHCNYNIECMMNDARGSINQVDREKIWFCNKCWKFIKRK